MTVSFRIPYFFLLPICKYIFYIIIIYLYIIYNIRFMVSYKKSFLKTVIIVIVITVIVITVIKKWWDSSDEPHHFYGIFFVSLFT